MNHGKILALAAMAALMLGCNAETPSANVVSAPVTAQAPAGITAPATLSAQQSLEQKLKKDMPYADLRKIVLDNGWLPLKTAACKENVGGEALICDQQPEVESCSGDGHCNRWFAHGDSWTKLRVGSYGDTVTFWEFSSNEINDEATYSLSAETCSPKGYWSFFEAFVKSQEIQKTHTSRTVRVFNYANKTEIKEMYDFKIGLIDYNWAYLDPAKNASNYERINIKGKLSGDTFRVDYQKAEFGEDDELLKTYGDPGAYVFELQSGCWQLTQEFR